MKKKSWFFVILFIAVGTFYANYYDIDFSSIANTNDKVQIVLDFTPQPISELERLDIDGKWNHIISHVVDFSLKPEGISIHIYEIDKGECRIILDDYNGFYNMDITIREEDIDRLLILSEDLNSNGNQELVVIIDRGTTYKEVNVFTYNDSKWQCILTAENLIATDLSNDGKPELITTSMGSLPPYVLIYRWSGDFYEKADINEETGFLYSTLININEETYIEAGNPEEPHFFKYKEGKLIEYNINKN